MSIDNTKYINTYIETLMAFIHENVTNALQFKTQLKLTNDLVSEKSEVISTLTAEKENLLKQIAEKDKVISQHEAGMRTEASEKNDCREQLRIARERNNVLEQERVKLDSLIVERDNIIRNFNAEKENIARNVAAEKDAIIQGLAAERNKAITELQECLGSLSQSKTDQRVVQNARNWEAEYNAMKAKVAHMDTFAKQMGEMKKQILERDEEIRQLSSNGNNNQETNKIIDQLNAKIQELTTENDRLNTKEVKKKTIKTKKQPPPADEIDF